MQSGGGFYQYPDPAYQQPGFLDSESDLESLAATLVTTLVASALVVAQAGVADAADIDLAWTAGASMDTGPFAILEQIGVEAFGQRFARHLATGRFAPERALLVEQYLKNQGLASVTGGQGSA